MKSCITILFLLIVNSLFAQNDKQLVVKGNLLYKKQDYDKAAAEYKKAADKNNKNVEAQYNLGNALYKSKKTDEAQAAFDAAAEIGDKSVKASSAYNKGVVLTRQNKLKESIDAYKQSLRQLPDDEEVRENLQKAINDLKKQDQKQQPKQDPKNNPSQNQQQDQKEQPKNKSKLNQKQAEQMLNAVRQEEKKLQQNHQKQKGKPGGQPDKDW